MSCLQKADQFHVKYPAAETAGCINYGSSRNRVGQFFLFPLFGKEGLGEILLIIICSISFLKLRQFALIHLYLKTLKRLFPLSSYNHLSSCLFLFLQRYNVARHSLL